MKKEVLESLDNAIYSILLNIEKESNIDEKIILMKRVEDLYSIRKKISEPLIDYKTIASLVTNLTGILLILNYEKIGIISTKALSFINKPKI